MKHNWFRITLYGSFLLLLAACSGAGAPTLPNEPLAEPAALPTVAATQGEPELSQPTSTQMEPEMTQPAPLSGMENLIELAKEDLAQRLSISVYEINLIEAKAVTWPNASLGCPQPGMVYAEVLTPGYLIKLDANGEEYEYHTSRGSEVIYCEDPIPPVPGTPEDV